MPPLVIPNAVLVRLLWSKGGTPWAVNVLGAQNLSAAVVNQALANSVGGAIKSAFTSSSHVGNIHPTISLAQVGLRNIAQANQAEFLDAGAAVVGTATGDLLPPQTSLAITLRTALAGRSFRGRVFLGGWAESTNEASGSVGAGAAGLAVAFVTAIQSALTAGGLTLAILSRKNSVATPVTGIVTRDLRWDTQRNRSA